MDINAYIENRLVQGLINLANASWEDGHEWAMGRASEEEEAMQKCKDFLDADEILVHYYFNRNIDPKEKMWELIMQYKTPIMRGTINPVDTSKVLKRFDSFQELYDMLTGKNKTIRMDGYYTAEGKFIYCPGLDQKSDCK